MKRLALVANTGVSISSTPCCVYVEPYQLHLRLLTLLNTLANHNGATATTTPLAATRIFHIIAKLYPNYSLSPPRSIPSAISRAGLNTPPVVHRVLLDFDFTRALALTVVSVIEQNDQLLANDPHATWGGRDDGVAITL